ncbi:Terminase-like family protein [Rivularia sp. PCC 7116]|uniref:phage terminase large subunit family protein n=1 Tax=Rivularia sp. PCC 7116 TaxID=373994 RepID=UPI0012FA7DDC|nr:Terminase-like family protein [Rivularia sp. PCC 7116]
MNPSPKQIEKYYGRDDLLPLPEKWVDFAPLTLIRSGGQVIPFIPFAYQKKIIELAGKYNKIICIKSRQLGYTELWQNYALFEACTNPGTSAFLFLRNGVDASTSSRRTKLMMRGLVDYVRAANDSVYLLKIAGGGEVNFKNSGAEGARGANSSTFLLFDESAFIPSIAQIYGSSVPSGAMSDAIGKKPCLKVIQSTPSARSGWYWDQLSQNNGDRDIEEIIDSVVNGELYNENIPGFYWFEDDVGACKIVCHWSANEVYRKIPDFLEWRKKEDGTDEETIQREYQLKFNDQQVAVFDFGAVKSCAVGEWQATPEEGSIIYAGLDTATTGEDYVVLQVLAFKNGKYSLIHTYSKRKQTMEHHLFQICKVIEHYKIRKCGVEVTGGVGQVYYEKLVEEFRGKGIEFERLKTTQETKQKRISDFILALEKRSLIYPEKSNLVSELLSFRREGTKLSASHGKHDDEIMSLSFAYAVATSTEEVEWREQEYLDSLNPEEKLNYYQKLLESE